MQYNHYDIKTTHKKVLVDFDDSEASAFTETFGREMSNIVSVLCTF